MTTTNGFHTLEVRNLVYSCLLILEVQTTNTLIIVNVELSSYLQYINLNSIDLIGHRSMIEGRYRGRVRYGERFGHLGINSIIKVRSKGLVKQRKCGIFAGMAESNHPEKRRDSEIIW